MAVRKIAEITSDIELQNAEGHILAEVSVNGNPWLSTKDTTVTRNNLVAPATAVDATGQTITGEIPQNSSDAIKIEGTNLSVPAGVYSENIEYDLENDLSNLIQGNVDIDSNGIYNVLDKATVTVEVPQGATNPTSLTIIPSTESQVFDINDDEEHDSYNMVTVNAIPTGYVIPQGTVEITSNGSHDVAGKATAVVSVPAGGLNPTTLTVNPSQQIQTFYPSDGHDAFSQVTVNAMPAGSVTIPATTISSAPSITVDSATGIITAIVDSNRTVSPTVEEGYVTDVDSEIIWAKGRSTLQLSTENVKAITPTKSSQTAITGGKYTLGDITVNPIPNEYIIPSGQLEITGNSPSIDVRDYSTVKVAVPTGGLNPQQFTNITPTESSQTIVPDTTQGYDSISSVQINAIPNTYVGTGINRRALLDIDTNMTITSSSEYFTGTDIKTDGLTIEGSSRLWIKGTNLTGYLYPGDKITVDNTVYTVERKTSSATNNAVIVKITPTILSEIPDNTPVTVEAGLPYVEVPNGYYENDATIKVKIADHVAPGISLSSESNSLKITATHTQEEGYLKTEHTSQQSTSIAALGAATYYPSATDQTIAAEQYLSGDQTIKAVQTNLSAASIKAGETITIGDSENASRVTSITGTYTADATATAADVLQNKTAYINGQKVTGTMTDNGAVTHTLDANTGNQSYTIPAGKHNGEGSVEIVLEQKTATPSTSTQTVTPTSGKVLSQVTVNPIPSQYIIPTGSTTITQNGTGFPVSEFATVDVNVSADAPVLQAKTVDPSESQQIVTPDSGKDGLSSVTVNAIPSDYVGSEVPQKTISDVSVGSFEYTSNNTYAYISATVTVPAGFYSNTAGGGRTTNILNVSNLPTQPAITITPTETAQTAVSKWKWTTGNITVAAIPSTYIGSDIDLRSATDITVSGASITTPAGYYEDSITKSVATGTAGTPTITKTISASDHLATLTPSVTNTTGYITGGTAISGEAVTVSAAELVSGKRTITTNGTNINVTNYATVDVQVPTGTSSITTQSKEITPTTSTQIVEPDTGYDALDSVQVNAIPSNYADVTNDTITAASMLSGRTAHALINGVATQIVGTIPTKSWEDITYQTNGNNLEFEIPYGFYFAEDARINGVEHPAPVISLDEINSGRIVATHTQPVGWNGRSEETTAQVNITTKSSATYYPSSTDQTIASGRYLIGTQTIKAVTSTNLAAENIKSGVTVEIGDESDSDRVTSVTGTYTSDATATAAAILASETAYVNGAKITGTIPTLTLPTAAEIAATTGYINKATISRSTSNQFINIPAGYNATGAYYQISGVPNGSISAPSAAKGTVENNSISITPSVVSTTGYITGGTVSGTPVSVTAAELVSGTKTISVNGTQIDVTNFQYVDVTVPSEATPMTAATILSICTIE